MDNGRKYDQGGRSGGYRPGAATSQRPQINLAGEDLVDVQAVQWAEYITGKERRQLSTHQLRRFYSEVKNIDRLRKNAPDKWADSFYPRVKLIVAKAVYNTKRQSNKISEQFREFRKVELNRSQAIRKPALRYSKNFVYYSKPSSGMLHNTQKTKDKGAMHATQGNHHHWRHHCR